MSEWKECKLEKVAEVQTGPFGSQLKNEQYITGGTPVVTVEHINNFRIVDFEYPSVTDEDRDRLSKYLLKAGDIIFTRVGSVDLSAFVKPHQDGWMFSSRMLRVRLTYDVDSKFLSYFFQQKRFRKYILNISVGATMPSINTEILKGIPITYPPLLEQKAIASVLSSLDDKIDLLHRQNKTLEAMAETLFRQWFVEEADEGWEETKIGKVLQSVLGGTPSTKKPEYWDGDIPWINSGEVNNFRILQGSKFITELGLKKSNTKLLPKGTTVLAITGATLGQVSLLEIDTCANQSVVGVLPNDKLPKTYVFLWIKLKIQEIILNETGGAQPHINKNDINETEIILPDEKSMQAGMKSISPLFHKITTNSFQIRILEKLRDTLLPKLMSGEVRVAVEEAGAEEEAVDPISPHIDESITPWPVNKKFREAVLFSGIVAEMGDEKFNPDRVRVIKAGYLAKRYMGMEVLGKYAKMEAGPYDPAIRYKGPEKISIKNKYVEAVETTHFKRGEKFQDAEKHLERYGYMPALEWLAQFKYTKNKELELLATVDYTALDIMRQEKDVTVESIMAYLEKDEKWSKKLEKKADVFNEEGVRWALKKLSVLFTETYNRVPK